MIPGSYEFCDDRGRRCARIWGKMIRNLSKIRKARPTQVVIQALVCCAIRSADMLLGVKEMCLAVGYFWSGPSHFDV